MQAVVVTDPLSNSKDNQEPGIILLNHGDGTYKVKSLFDNRVADQVLGSLISPGLADTDRKRRGFKKPGDESSCSSQANSNGVCIDSSHANVSVEVIFLDDLEFNLTVSNKYTKEVDAATAQGAPSVPTASIDWSQLQADFTKMCQNVIDDYSPANQVCIELLSHCAQLTDLAGCSPGVHMVWPRSCRLLEFKLFRKLRKGWGETVRRCSLTILRSTIRRRQCRFRNAVFVRVSNMLLCTGRMAQRGFSFSAVCSFGSIRTCRRYRRERSAGKCFTVSIAAVLRWRTRLNWQLHQFIQYFLSGCR